MPQPAGTVRLRWRCVPAFAGMTIAVWRMMLCSQSADCQHIPHRQPADSVRFSKITASRTIRAGTAPIIPPSRRWGGRRIQRLDVGGLWSSDEARAEESPGVLREVDGWPPFARRAPLERTAGARPSCPPRVAAGNVCGVIRLGPKQGLPTGWRVENGCAGQVCFVETVKQSKHRARPGRPAPSPNFPAAMPESDQSWVVGGW